MVWIKQLKVVGVLMVLAGIVTACSISYKFNGSSIDYTKVKTISFENFPNRSAGFVWDRWRACSIRHCRIFICSRPG